MGGEGDSQVDTAWSSTAATAVFSVSATNSAASPGDSFGVTPSASAAQASARDQTPVKSTAVQAPVVES